MDTKEQLSLLQEIEGISFEKIVNGPLLRADSLDILQLNVGRKCNLSCKHCHVKAGPHRKEVMSKEILQQCLNILQQHPSISTVDITGGAPEMNPHLKWFIDQTSKLNKRIIVRSNLVILLEEEYRHFLDLYEKNNVELWASLPDYRSFKSERQRGQDFFHKIISVIKELNQRSFGKPNSDLILNLVHNPVGAYLPASQEDLEYEYRHKLSEEYNISFNKLYCITNMPVGRYLEFLIRSENYQEYMDTLIKAFNPQALDNLMCKSTLSVGWDGMLYDCDFNQMLNLPIKGPCQHINDFNLENIKNNKIVLCNHCFGCTAGAGSSCQGETC